MRPLPILVLSTALSLPAYAQTPATCNVSAQDLVGAWTAAAADGDAQFDTFELVRDADGDRFNEWLHARPGITGAQWRFDPRTCALSVRQGDDLALDARVSLPRRDLLQLVRADGTPAGAYHRVAP